MPENSRPLFGYSEIIADAVLKINNNLFQNGQTNQNIIFHGPPGNGKTELFTQICLNVKKDIKDNVYI